MADLAILRLYPSKAMSGADFRALLGNLSIEVFDLSVDNSRTGVALGTASGLANVDANVDVAATQLIQHWFNLPVPASTESVATAVIEVNLAGQPEYQTTDLRISVTSGGRPVLLDHPLEFNVEILSVAALSNLQQDYFALPASAYVQLPESTVPIGPGVASLIPPKDGTAPPFDLLVSAVDTVLAADPGAPENSLVALTDPLTPAQAMHIAREIVGNRVVFPAPEPDATIGSTDHHLAGLYTWPSVEGLNKDDVEKARSRFEAEQAARYGRLEADALRLAQFVFAASASIAAERLSIAAAKAAIGVPIVAGGAVTPRRFGVGVTDAGGLTPAFAVPAAVFYALGFALPPQISPEQRFDLARLTPEERLIGSLADVVATGAITFPVGLETNAGPPPINLDQAARRLAALGLTTPTVAELQLVAPIDAIVQRWLAFAGASTTIEQAFWLPEANANQADYLRLVLLALTKSHIPLVDAVTAAANPVTNTLGIGTVADLMALTDAQWRLVLSDAARLPDFTKPGTPAERAEAFIRHLKSFFAVPPAANAAPNASQQSIPLLAVSSYDPVGRFIAQYPPHAGGVPFDVTAPLNPAAVRATAQDVFPGDEKAQAWLIQAITTLVELLRVTAGVAGELRFSVIEALYARGFTSAADIAGLSPADFKHALTGTVAYPAAAGIYSLAGGAGGPLSRPPGTFNPVNPNGRLTDCVPPEHLSPLGPVQYLHELLNLSEHSTCKDPAPPFARRNLADVLKPRRGPLGELTVSRSNLEIPLPLIDLVNENLEQLVMAPARAREVYDTAAGSFRGHAGHDPAVLFGALAEHSSPACPLRLPDAYDQLRTDFAHPDLPYSQPLDVNRSYLGALQSTRFSAMRHFRHEITEFAIDPAGEPPAFRRHQWRLPVRIEIALEYLGISPEEHNFLYGGGPRPTRAQLRTMFGIAQNEIDGRPWTDVARQVPKFLAATGLTYCEFVDLWKSAVIPFSRERTVEVQDEDVLEDGEGFEDGEGGDNGEGGENGGQGFPDCQPCCPDDLVMDFGGRDVERTLRRLIVFVRLWRTLQNSPCARLTFEELGDVAEVFGLWQGAGVDGQFIRQLAAFTMLREFFCLPLRDESAAVEPGQTGAARTHLLALWQPAADHAQWALETFLAAIDEAAEYRNPNLAIPAELEKLTPELLGSLSRLAGFDPDRATDVWNAKPTHTLRFAEALLKLSVSEFTAGELLFLFRDEHVDNDPFALPTAQEAAADPLELADDSAFDLWALRRKLLEVPTEDDLTWTWARIASTLSEEFGYSAAAAGQLETLGARFFPAIVAREGFAVPAGATLFRAPLAVAQTNPIRWNTPPNGPFVYDAAAGELTSRIPRTDSALAEKLASIWPLNPDERRAVQDLTFAPRAALAPFALMFDDFNATLDRLTIEPDEDARFALFRSEFIRFYRRVDVIADHLAAHVSSTARAGLPPLGRAEVLRILRSFHGDENLALAAWENDNGSAPALSWPDAPTGSAVAALLGLTGTGLVGEFTTNGDPAWRELRGPFTAFTEDANAWNAPVPALIPALDLAIDADAKRLVTLRNGFALRNLDGEPLGGAQPFSVRWTGMLLIEEPGEYLFAAGAPTPEGELPDHEHCPEHRWRVELRRGHRPSVLLNRNWSGEDAPDNLSGPIQLRSGAYEISIDFAHDEPTFDDPEEIQRRRTGFQIKYCGADSGQEFLTIPRSRLYRTLTDSTLDTGLPLVGAAQDALRARYTSSLRDIRRTYQRAFKAALVVHRFGLSADLAPGDRQSELGYLLDHPADFAGQSIYRVGAGFAAHLCDLNIDLLPVADPYHSPTVAQDQRVQPSARRQAALFDWWERLFDYVCLRTETAIARGRPAWRLFYEAADGGPVDAAELVRHLAVDAGHADQVLTFFDPAGDREVLTNDLVAEAWATRVWRAEVWLDRLGSCFRIADLSRATPHRWVADDPAAGPDSGNCNLTRFVEDGSIETGPPRRYSDLRKINDGLRSRARDALVNWLCALQRVPLPFAPGTFATTARDLSDLLLQDVETGLEKSSSRIEDAIGCVHAFIHRARLGLEAGFVVSPGLVELWDGRFSTFRQWQCCRERELYPENWIEWDELAQARHVEAFRLLEDELRRGRLTVAVPGGGEWWPGQRPPAHGTLTPLQHAVASQLRALTPGVPAENLDLLGTPDADGQPSWLAPLPARRAAAGEEEEEEEGGIDDDVVIELDDVGLPGELDFAAIPQAERDRLPFWIQTAVRLGTRFVRVAAAGVPPADAPFEPCEPPGDSCCCLCGEEHAPVIDEYYFWLKPGEQYDARSQDADLGKTEADPTSDWEREAERPTLLDWPSHRVVYLYWSRRHRGRFEAPRRSADAVRIDRPADQVQLAFMGRTGDSLRFEVSDAQAPPGHDPAQPPGFRYDLATDSALSLPLVRPAQPLPPLPGGLAVYPYFLSFCPGGPVQPLSLFATAVTVAGALRANCRHEAALKWYQLVRNTLAVDDAWTECDRHRPQLVDEEEGDEVVPIEALVRPRRAGGACCPTIATDDDHARQRAIDLLTIETLFDHAAAARPALARISLDVADRLLGPRPPTIEATDNGPITVVEDFVALPARLNPRLVALYDRVGDARQLIQHNLNAARLRNDRHDAALLRGGLTNGGWSTSDCGCEDCAACCAHGCRPYRFTTLLQKATELVGEARSFGAALLAAFEKGDAEHLAALRVTQERQILERGLREAQLQWRDADWQVQALQKSKEGALTRLRYYQNLIEAGLNAGEIAYIALAGASMGSRLAATVVDAIAQGIGVTPDMWFGAAGIMGSPLQFNQLPVGVKLSHGFVTAARILTTVADMSGTGSGLSLTLAGWERRAEEWQHQVDVISIEIQQIERQIRGADARREQLLSALDRAQLQIENAIEVQNFTRDRFSSHDLYLFLQRETAALYYRAYELARCAVSDLQYAFNFERGFIDRDVLPEQSWDNLREGLLAGERLSLAVKELDKAYTDENCREYELTKRISLRTAFPEAFLQLQTSGRADIDIPEWMFDHDYPGHYMRRIKSVSLSFPAVVHPVNGVHCRLTMLSSRTRVSPRLDTATVDCCHEQCSCAQAPCTCGCKPPTPQQPCCHCGATDSAGYGAQPDDTRIVALYGATEAIATSTGQNDAGLFELNFRDERYLPFEFGGAVSRWRIELPPENNHFNLLELADCELNFFYTAREGGDLLREAAGAVAQTHLPGDGQRYFDARQDLPEALPALTGCATLPRQFDFKLAGRDFPYVPLQKVEWVDRVQIFLEAECAAPQTTIVVRFVPHGECHHNGQPCECDRIDIACTANSDYPGHFWGELDLSQHGPLGPLDADRPTKLGRFEFPDSIGKICGIRLIVDYCASSACACGQPTCCFCAAKDAASGCGVCRSPVCGCAGAGPREFAAGDPAGPHLHDHHR